MPDRLLFAFGTLLVSTTLLLGQGMTPDGNCVGAPAAASNLGPGCGGPPPSLFASVPVLGSAVFAQVTSSFPNAHTFVYMSVGIIAPFAIPGIPGCTVYVDLANPANFILIEEGFTDATGVFMLPLQRIPNNPSLHGLQVTVQGEVWSAGGPVFGDHLTNGLLLTLGC